MKRSSLATLAFSSFVVAACSSANVDVSVPAVDVKVSGGDPSSGSLPGVDVSTQTATAATPATSSAPAASTAAPSADGFFACRLPAPVKSDDPCSTDADCAPATPCHARACVARAKAKAPDPSSVCTHQLACDSVDANRCGCFEGRCSLIPPK